MAKFVKNGERMTVKLAADIAAWTPLLIGDRVFVACSNGVTDEEIEFQTDGVWEMLAGGAIAQGKNVKMDNTTKNWTVSAPDAGGATPGDAVHGIAYKAAADGLVWVKLLS